VNPPASVVKKRSFEHNNNLFTKHLVYHKDSQSTRLAIMPSLALPDHIHTVLITGAAGFVGRELVQLLLEQCPRLRLVTTDIHRPPTYGVEDENRLVAVAADLGDKEQVAKLFDYGRVQGVFALQ